ncbi:MAG TPA: beta-propeller fold lactonase family protein [Gemmataceae bacterium]
MGCALALLARVSGPAAEKHPTTHRSPIDLAVLPGGRLALTANHTADSASLIDIKEGKVLAEQACGRKPSAVAVSPDGRRAAVSNLWSGKVSLLEIDKATLKTSGEVAVGPLPRGLVFAHDGESLYVAASGADEVVQVDWSSRKVKQRWTAPREPRTVALSADGRKLAVASTRSAQVRCWDTHNGKLLWERRIEDGFNLRGLSFTPDDEGLICAHALRRSFPVTKENIEEGWVIDNRLTWFAVAADAKPAMKQIAVDQRGKAVADLYGLAVDRKAGQLILTGSGTRELVLLDADHIPWTTGDPGDFLSPKFDLGDHKMRRMQLGGRPLAIAFLDDHSAAVANYLSDSVQVVDVEQGKVIRSITLGGPEEPSLARRGETLFYDAQRSHDQWFSCSTCHVEGHTCGLNFDTLNDDSYGNPKLTPTLRNVAKTGPWTWHGWQKDLGAAVEKSYLETMFGPRPTAAESKAVVAFLETLDQPPNPRAEESDEVKRGQAVFKGKARCAKCHKGNEYTSESNYDVKLEPDGSPYRLWNPPSLRGLWDRGPFLHDGRAATLKDLLEKHHESEKLGGEALTDDERRDLIAFLQSL